MADDEKLTSAEADVRNQAMLQDLQHMYAPIDDDRQSLERIRARLLATGQQPVQASRRLRRNNYSERYALMDIMHIPVRRLRNRYLNVLVASLVAILLIGSLLLVVS